MASNIFNKPDLKANRYKKKGHAVDISKLVRVFKRAFPQYKHKITAKEYRSIIDKYTFYIRNKILETRDGVELPEGLGYIMIVSYKSKKRLLNKKQSEIHGVKIYETNLHSDGFNAKIVYTNDKMKYKLSNRDMWGFKATDQFRRDVAKVFRENWKIFTQMNLYKKLCRIIDKNIKYKPLLDPETTYNEFDI